MGRAQLKTSWPPRRSPAARPLPHGYAAARTPARTAAARAPQTQARWARPLATTPATLSPGEDLGSFDYGFTKDRIDKGASAPPRIGDLPTC